MCKAGVAGVVAPQNHDTAVLDLRHRPHAAGADAADPKGVVRGKRAAPAADVEGIARVWSAEGVHQPPDIAGRITDCGPGAVRQGPRRARTRLSSREVDPPAPPDPPEGRSRPWLAAHRLGRGAGPDRGPVGCAGSGSRRVKRPSSTTATQP